MVSELTVHPNDSTTLNLKSEKHLKLMALTSGDGDARVFALYDTQKMIIIDLYSSFQLVLEPLESIGGVSQLDCAVAKLSVQLKYTFQP